MERLREWVFAQSVHELRMLQYDIAIHIIMIIVIIRKFKSVVIEKY